MKETEDFKFFSESIERYLKKAGNAGGLKFRKVVSAYDLVPIEHEFISKCEKHGVPVTTIDCRTLYSHTDFCHTMRKIQSGTAVILSHVTEIPYSADQTYIGYAINSVKEEEEFFDLPAEDVMVLITYLPSEEIKEPFLGALAPTMPGGLTRFDREWNIKSN